MRNTVKIYPGLVCGITKKKVLNEPIKATSSSIRDVFFFRSVEQET